MFDLTSIILFFLNSFSIVYKLGNNLHTFPGHELFYCFKLRRRFRIFVTFFYHSIVYKHINMSYFAYACKTEGKNGISRLISALCVNCLNSIPEYSRIIDYSNIWMCIWCGLLQKLYKIKKSELLNSKVYSKV